MYPLSLLLDGNALNITLITRHDSVDFGLIACRKSVPHMQRLLDYLESALSDLEVAAKQHTSKLSVVDSGNANTAKKTSNQRKKAVARKSAASSDQSKQTDAAPSRTTASDTAPAKKAAARRKVTARSHKKVAKAKSA